MRPKYNANSTHNKSSNEVRALTKFANEALYAKRYRVEGAREKKRTREDKKSGNNILRTRREEGMVGPSVFQNSTEPEAREIRIK